jgi:hypothetical protein
MWNPFKLWATSEDANLANLQRNLDLMPQQMQKFSRGLRSLYAENAVSGAQSMESFRKLRDDVQYHAYVYVNQVLPVASTMVLNLSSYFDTYLTLDFEDWLEIVDNIVKDLENYENASQPLKDNKLIVSLKKLENEANKIIAAMEEQNAQLEEKEYRLNNEAAGKPKIAKEDNFANSIGTGVPYVPGVASIEMGAAVAEGLEEMGENRVALKNQPNHLELEAKSLMVQKVSEKENARLAREAAKITQDVLIPAVAKFLDGLRECQSFFAQTKSKLSNSGEKAVNMNLKNYYKIMKKNAEKINASCDCFFGVLGEVSMKPLTT